MRKLLLASAAIMGAGSGVAVAQAPNPTQGQYAAPSVGGPGANNAFNLFGSTPPGPGGTVLPGTPAPGTVVIRLNGRVVFQADADWSSLSQVSPGAYTTAAGTKSLGYKVNPISFGSYLRLYPGVDAMATNGLRYGAAAEIRENFEGGNSLSGGSAVSSVASSGSNPYPAALTTGGTAASASGVSSAQTLYVRRAFAYIGSDQAGIIRVGNGDGLIGIYDGAGIFTGQNFDLGMGNLNDGAMQATLPNNYLQSWPFLSGNGIEYGNTKMVYLSPSFFGFDVGLQYDPNMGNSFTESSTSSPYQVGPCGSAGPDCINATAGADSSRVINRVVLGARYNNTFAGFNLQGYGTYTASGHESAPTTITTPNLMTGVVGAPAANIQYIGQSFFNGGLAASYMGFTVGGDVTIGYMNPGNDGTVANGAVETKAGLVEVSYANGPLSMGVAALVDDWEGTPLLIHTSQRHEVGLELAAAYKLAPGIVLGLEYQYELKHQTGFDFVTGAAGATSNGIHGQGLTFATIVSW